ncbi:HGGxSTG domain-containing protein [Oceanicaulis alexandrii]|uniref:HGGxSTG domain-containing protein n=1 Tax=Oceanicaulis alexandrii TaxID=153233 RepID=UPI002354CD5A|nr:HGGxSTG domain-containing protein [Oceanicaulis alexandrii]
MAGSHLRNAGPMTQSLRCGAKTRAGAPCRSPAVAGKTRCRMHGGAKGSGAPKGNQNAFKNGLYTQDAIEARKAVNALIREAKRAIEIVAGD